MTRATPLGDVEAVTEDDPARTVSDAKGRTGSGNEPLRHRTTAEGPLPLGADLEPTRDPLRRPGRGRS